MDISGDGIKGRKVMKIAKLIVNNIDI